MIFYISKNLLLNLFIMKRLITLVAVVATGCILTGCSLTDLFDIPNFSDVEDKGYEVTESGIYSYVVADGETYGVNLAHVTAVEQTKIDTVDVVFSKLAFKSLGSPKEEKTISEKTLKILTKTKKERSVSAVYDGMDYQVPFRYVDERAFVKALGKTVNMPYPDFKFEISDFSEEKIDDIIVGDNVYKASLFTFYCDLMYDDRVVPLVTKVVGREKVTP